MEQGGRTGQADGTRRELRTQAQRGGAMKPAHNPLAGAGMVAQQVDFADFADFLV